MRTYEFPLVAEAESADGPQGGHAERGAAVQDTLVAKTGLSVPAVLPQQQHVGQVRDVAGGQAQGFYFGELPVGGLGGNERAERCEGGVHAVSPVPLPRVCRLSLLVHTGQTRVSAAPVAAVSASPSQPRRTSTRTATSPCVLPRVSARAAATDGLFVGAVAAAVQVVQVGDKTILLRGAACGLHPESVLVCVELLGPCERAAAAHHFILGGSENSTGGQAAAADPVTEKVCAGRPPGGQHTISNE